MRSSIIAVAAMISIALSSLPAAAQSSANPSLHRVAECNRIVDHIKGIQGSANDWTKDRERAACEADPGPIRGQLTTSGADRQAR